MSSAKWRLSCLGLHVLTHWGRVTHICVNKLAIIGSDNQCWNIVNWTLGNKLQRNLNRKLNIFIQENAFENVVWKMAAIFSRPQCVKTSFSRPLRYIMQELIIIRRLIVYRKVRPPTPPPSHPTPAPQPHPHPQKCTELYVTFLHDFSPVMSDSLEQSQQCPTGRYANYYDCWAGRQTVQHIWIGGSRPFPIMLMHTPHHYP